MAKWRWESDDGVTEYDRYLEMVNDAQLDLESVKGDVKTSAAAFSNAQSIFDALESMEQYLGRVVKEYEEHRNLVEQRTGWLPTHKSHNTLRLLGESRGREQIQEIRD
jgi:hypothetical protein